MNEKDSVKKTFVLWKSKNNVKEKKRNTVKKKLFFYPEENYTKCIKKNPHDLWAETYEKE